MLGAVFIDFVNLLVDMAVFARNNPEHKFLASDDPGRALIGWTAYRTLPDGSEDARRWDIPLSRFKGYLFAEPLRLATGRKTLAGEIRGEPLQKFARTQLFVQTTLRRYRQNEFALVVKGGQYGNLGPRYIARDQQGYFTTTQGTFLKFRSAEDAQKYLERPDIADILQRIQEVAVVTVEALGEWASSM